MSNYKTGKVLTAICFLVVGGILILNSFGIDIPILFKGWWTLFLIVPGLIQIINGHKGDRMGGSFLLILGVGLLLQQLEYFTSAKTTWFFIGGGWLILLGISYFHYGTIFEVSTSKKKKKYKKEGSEEGSSATDSDDDW